MRKRPRHSQRYDGPESIHRNSLWKEFMVAKAQERLSQATISCACKTQGREVGFTLLGRVLNSNRQA